MFKLILILSIAQSLYAFDYFNSNINYWETKKEDSEKPNKDKKKTNQNKDTKFSWNEYLNPKNDKFFDEGNYSPPKPYLELIRNPTDKNIKNWFKIVNTKNKLLSRLQDRVQAYARKNTSYSNGAKSKIQALENYKSKPNIERFHFRLYIDSKCPHCKRMLKTMEKLQHNGYYVEVKQIDNDYKAMQGIPLNITPANIEDVSKKDIKSVPVLFVGDLRKKQVFRVQGYRNHLEIFQIIQNSPAYK